MKKAILISCYGWYEKRLRPIKQILQKEYTCKVVVGDFVHALKAPVSTKYEDCTYIHVKPYKKNLSVRRLYSHYDFSRKIYQLLKREKPDLIYVLLPPNSLGKYCAKYRKKHKKCFLIFDVIDMWPESMPLDKVKNTFPCKIWRDMRNKALENADYVFTECALYQDELKAYMSCDYSTLYLMKSQTAEEAAIVRERISHISPISTRETIVIGYLGNINNIIDILAIENIVSALVRDYDVEVRIIGDGEKRRELVNLLEKTGTLVKFYGKIYNETKKIEILAGCDVALNIMKDNLKVGLTIKSIDYFAYGIPIINNIKGDTWSLVEKEGLGINFTGDLQKMIKYVEKLDIGDHLRVAETYNKLFSESAFNNTIEEAFLSVNKEV